MKATSYSPKEAVAWNAFVSTSKNGTFLFSRDYMDYHRDRFEDASVMIYADGGELVAVFPANRRSSIIVSHGGLTYGGIAVGPKIGTSRFLEVFAALVGHLKAMHLELLEYKVVPNIYHLYPAEEDQYALFLLGAELIRRDVSSAIYPMKRLPVHKGRKSDLNKAIRHALQVEESGRWAEFWEILSANLRDRHDVKPVHTLEEIMLLQSRFPANIRLFTVLAGSEVAAGTVIYETQQVAHTQYIGCSEFGRKCGALDILFSHLLDRVYPTKPCFDFGISSVNGGRFLNKGLIEFKESLGARAVVHDIYRVNLVAADPSALKADCRGAGL